MTSYPETLTVKKLIKMGFFIIKIYYISSSNDPNITYTKNHISIVSRTLTRNQFPQTLLTNPSKLRIYLRRIPTVITETLTVLGLFYTSNFGGVECN
jgi:hypothetical protein